MTESTLAKALRILDLLEEAPEGALPFEVLHSQLGFTRSTLYRYLKTLQDAGLAASIPDHGFTLGPRVAELDYSMRQRDPLIAAARPVMAALATELPGIALLCRRYRDRVLCVHQEGSLASGLRSNYERGLAMPLFRGAASRAILAYLPGPTLTRLQARHAAAFAEAGLGDTPALVRRALRAIRRRGWDRTEGQVTPGVTGIAAPILDSEGMVLGSLSVTLQHSSLPDDDAERFAARIVAGAREVAAALTV